MTTDTVETLIADLIPPGEHIRDWLEDFGMSITEFYKRMGISRATYYRILDGTQPITAEFARRLELVTGASAEYWNNLESNYRHELALIEVEKEAQDKKDWINKHPIADLTRRGILPKDFRKRNLGEQLSLLCAFYNVSSIDSYAKIHTPYEFAARAVKGVESNDAALTAWLQLAARIASNKIATLADYDELTFKQTLDEIRSQTVVLNQEQQSLKEFLLEIQKKFEASGVLLIYLEKIKGVKNLNGVTFWINHTPVIVLTLHSGQDDKILFSLYHEAAHLLEGRKELFYVAGSIESEIEKNADSLAGEMLLSTRFNDEIVQTNANLSLLTKIAKQANVYVGIVIGRYKHLKKKWNIVIPGFKPKKISWQELGTWTF